MNLFDCVICNQYYDLVNTGRDGSKALFNGNLLNTTCIFLMLLTLCNLTLMNSALAENLFTWVGSEFGERSGKGLSELMALPLLALIYFIVKKTIGTKTRFDRIISEFDSMDETSKKTIFKRGSVFVFTCLGLFLITFFVQF